MPSTKRAMRPDTPEVAAKPVAPQPIPEDSQDAMRPVEALVQLAPVATVVVDTSGCIRLVNHLTEELFGYTADELLGQPVELLVPERLRGIHQQHQADYAVAPYVRPFGVGIPLSGQRHDGSEFPLKASLGPLQEADESLTIICFHDMSELEDAHNAQVAAQAAYQELHGLQVLTDTALSHLALDDLLPALLQRVTEVLGVDNAAVFLLDSTEQTLTMEAADMVEISRSTLVQIPVGHGITGRIAATREPLVVDDIAKSPIAAPLFHDQFHSLAGVPLEAGDQLLGVMLIGTTQARHFTPRDVQLLQQVADRMALAIDRARLFAAEQQARERLQAIMEAVPEALAVYDPAGRVILANAAHQARVLPGETLAERIQHTSDVFDAQGRPLEEDQWPPTRSLHGEVLSGADAVELSLRRPGGELVCLSVTSAPLRDQAGNIIGTVALNQNITERKRLERALQSSEAWFRTMADTAPVLLWVSGTDALVTFINAPWLRFTGRSLEQELGNGWVEGVHPGDYQHCLETYLTAFQARESFTMEYRLRRCDGEYRWVLDTGVPRYAADGSFEGYIGSAIDITEQKQLERERADQAEQLDRLFESISDGLMIYNTEGQMVRANAEARRILGLDAAPSEYTQWSLPDRLRAFEAYDEQGHRLEPEDWPAVQVLRGQVQGAAALEVRARTLDGREVELYARAEPLRDETGRLTGVVTVLHDQTEQKRLAREREEVHARVLAAERVAEQMSDFLAIAAHDIRSPLTVAAARVQLAKKIAERLAAALDAPMPALAFTAELPKLLAAEAGESLQRAYAAMDQLKRQVNLLFDVTQAQSQQLVLEMGSVDLGALIEEQVAALQVGVHGHRLQVQVPANAVLVEADADRLDQVLANFVSNALKYSPANQLVTVQLTVEEHAAVVRVVDQGPGIPLEEQSRVWDPFYRSPEVPLQPGSRTEKGSLGLGLAICKQLIELHPGGHIGVDSVVGAGSTFWFRLPLAS